MIKSKKKTFTALIIIAIMLVVSFSVIMLRPQTASTARADGVGVEVKALSEETDTSYFPGICGELYDKVGAGFKVNNKIYQNYERGYMEFSGDPTNAADKADRSKYRLVGSLNMLESGEEEISDKIFYDAEKKDAWLIGGFKSDQGDSLPAVKNILTSIGKQTDDNAINEISNLFKEKFISLYNDNGFNAGMARSYIKTWGNIICQEFGFGDGKDYDASNGGFSKYTVLIYNPFDNEVHMVSDRGLMKTWNDNDNWAAMGHAVSDVLEDKTVIKADGTSVIYKKLAIFQSGYTYFDGTNYDTVRGVSYDKTANKFVTVPTIDGAPGELGSPTVSYMIDSVFYQNYQRGYAKKTADGVQEFIGLRNISASGTISYVSDVWALDLVGKINDDPNLPADNESSATKIKSVLTNKITIEQLTAKFKAKVTSLMQKDDYAVGVMGSFVKVWNGYIVQDFQSGDGNFSWNNGSNFVTRINGIRCRMSTIVYNVEKDEMFAVSGDALKAFAYKSGRLGAPESDLLTVQMYVNQIATQTVQIQQFEKSLLWFFDGKEIATTIYGGKYDAATKKCTIIKSAPHVPTEYGNKISEYTVEGVFYTNYQHGAIKTEVRDNGLMAYDTYFTGREFSNAGVLSELKATSKTYYINLIDAVITNNAPNPPEGYGDKATFNTKLKAKYAQLWDSGYCAGIIDGRGAVTWVNAWTSQFYYGDSSAELGYGDDRHQLSVFVYNLKTGAQNETYFTLIDGEILNNYTWVSHTGASNFEHYGKPLEDAVTEANGDIHQKFEKGTAIILRNDKWLYSFVEGGTYQDYLNEKNEIKVPSHGDGSDEYIGNKYLEQTGCNGKSTNATAILSMLVAFGLIAFKIGKR